MLITLALLLAGAVAPRRDCPVAASVALPELRGKWAVLMINHLDGTRPDSTRAAARIAADLQGCILREQLKARNGTPPYEGLILWGVNGADSAIQRIFVHSQHGRFGVYEGRRVGPHLVLRQQSFSTQPDSVIVEHRVVIRDNDHFMLTSQLSENRGMTWTALSRWEYRRTP